MTTTNSWLPLAEYSMKHHVSISTLRRRIKAEDVKFRFDDGKYFILDEELKKMANAEEHRPSLSSNVQESVQTNSANAVQAKPNPQTEIPSETGESVISAANRLLADLKRAYTQVLQEKEEQILSLREETMDLKTLIKVLETENSRLRNQ
ncbi:hypothetical protein K2P97_02130 [bacterium]|nr:hypothetical protein [bacterium]